MPIIPKKRPKEPTLEEYMDKVIALKQQMEPLKAELDRIQKEILAPRFKAEGIENLERNGFQFIYVKGFPRFKQEVATEYAVNKYGKDGVTLRMMKDIFANGKGEPGEDYLQVKDLTK